MLATSADGVDIAVHDLGGAGPELLVVHATGFCAGAYGPLAASLRSQFHVWGVDLRGHGESGRAADGRQDWLRMAGDVLAAVDAIGAPSVLGFGHSLGGGALLLAERDRPGTVRAAFLFEPIVVPAGFVPGAGSFDSPGNPMAAAARRRRSGFASRPEALARYASRPPLGELRADALAAYVEHGFVDRPDGTVELRCSPEVEAATFEATGAITTNDVGELDLPVVVAVGNDGEAPAQFAAPLAEALPNGELVRFAHVGHLGPFQDPPSVAAAAVAALAGR